MCQNRMQDNYNILNSILVNLFNDIMGIEEKALIVGEFSDISVTDMHIIEAVGIGEPRTMSQISKLLDVTMGTLTIGINVSRMRSRCSLNFARSD